MPVGVANPAGAPVLVPGAGSFVTPARGKTSIRVYGSPYPEASAYPSWIKHYKAKLTPLQYTIPHGQKYVVIDRVTADYYWSPTMTQHAFIPPGGGVYALSTARFSAAGDVLLDVIYQAP